MNTGNRNNSKNNSEKTGSASSPKPKVVSLSFRMAWVNGDSHSGVIIDLIRCKEIGDTTVEDVCRPGAKLLTAAKNHPLTTLCQPDVSAGSSTIIESNETFADAIMTKKSKSFPSMNDYKGRGLTKLMRPVSPIVLSPVWEMEVTTVVVRDPKPAIC
ncbi:hypothetical protein J6590_048202 [Homalodisca vitripennis]|nr:hypothetical protein J6590_048202 [Homalodisca vitripennis]